MSTDISKASKMVALPPLSVAGVITSALAVLVTILLVRNKRRAWKDAQYGKAMGCGEPTYPPSTGWPFGIDMLRFIFMKIENVPFLRQTVEASESLGATWSAQVLFGRAISTVDPKNIEEVLSKQFHNFDTSDRGQAFVSLLGDGIFTQDGPKWKHSRALLRPHFSKQRDDIFDEMRTRCHELVESLEDGSTVDLQPQFFRLTLDVSLFFLFGESWASISDRNHSLSGLKFLEAFDAGVAYISASAKMGGHTWLVETKQSREACATVHRFIDEAIEQAIRLADGGGNPDRNAFVYHLLEETRERKVLRDQTLNILGAARDTTAGTLSWAFRLLARHPRVVRKLRPEILDIVGSEVSARGPDREDLKRMPYLANVVKEVIRLYPAAPFNGRRATKLTTIPHGGGPKQEAPLLIRAGESVLFSVYAMHRRKDLYGPDAHEFRPERWDPNAKEYNLNSIGWAYLPFNGGPRTCLGQEFAIQEISYAIVKILQAVPNVELPEGTVREPLGWEKHRLTLVLQPAHGCVVKLSR